MMNAVLVGYCYDDDDDDDKVNSEYVCSGTSISR